METWYKSLIIKLSIIIFFQFLHSKHVLHRDVKSKNILITGHMNLKIADFGVARYVGT